MGTDFIKKYIYMYINIYRCLCKGMPAAIICSILFSLDVLIILCWFISLLYKPRQPIHVYKQPKMFPQ